MCISKLFKSSGGILCGMYINFWGVSCWIMQILWMRGQLLNNTNALNEGLIVKLYKCFDWLKKKGECLWKLPVVLCALCMPCSSEDPVEFLYVIQSTFMYENRIQFLMIIFTNCWKIWMCVLACLFVCVQVWMCVALLVCQHFFKNHPKNCTLPSIRSLLLTKVRQQFPV